MMSSNSTVNTRHPSRPVREKAHKSNNPDHNKSTDGTSAKIQPTADQIRLAQMINDTKDMDDPELQSKIKQVMELTGRSSDEASVALHDCDNDPNRAIDMLLEGQADQGEWETSMKRKKNRPVTAPAAPEIVQTQPTVNNNKENKPRLDRSKEKPGKERENRNRMPPRMARGKVRDNDKNERNLEDGQQPEQHFERRGRGARMMNGPGRGGRGGRGGGRIRTFQSRGGSSNSSEFPRSIETWTNASANENNREEDRLRVGNWSDGFPPAEEWDNEDWTGSLAETKVFTPSSNMASTDYVGPTNKHPPPTGLEVSSLNLGLDVASQQSTTMESVSYDQNSLKSINYSQTPVDVGSSSVNQSLAFNMNVSENSTFSIPSSQVVAASNVHNEVTLCPSPLSLTSLSVSSGSTRSSSLQQTMSNASHPSHMGIPSRPKSQRPRGLGTSKIPASAVEMPDDAITTLDVQFGSLEFGSESPKLNLSSLLEATSIQSAIDRPSTISNHINLSTSNNSNSQVLSSSSVTNNSSLHMASSLVKTSADLDGVSDQNSRISYTSATTLAANPSSVVSVPHTNSSQVLSGSDMMSLGNVNDRKSSYSSMQRSSRSSALDIVLGGVSSSKSVSAGVNDSLSTYSVPSYQVNYGSSKSTAYSANNSSSIAASSVAQSQAQNLSSLYSLSPAAVVSTHTTSGYSQQPLTYQSYSNPAITSSSNYGSLNMTMSMASSKLNSSSKDQTDSASQHVYDGSNNLTSSLTTSSVASSLGLSGSSFTSANSTSSGKSPSTKSFDQGKSSMTSLPPGVPAVLSHPYIMGQAGVPFYSLPQPVYSYEDLQMIQQRMAPMSSFYDMTFQPSNSAMTARDTTGLNNMAGYSAAGSEGKFGRGESSSPVPSSSLPVPQSASQQQQHQQTFISPTALPPGYGYYYSGGVVAGGFAQYGPQIFPVATPTNTHAQTSNTHFQKPNAYSSHGYSSGYDSLGQTQDYSKSTYGSGSQSQSKAVSGGHMSLQALSNSMTANEMNQSVYSKGHTQMNKSFDKPGFHAGTPPPFNMSGSGGVGVGGGVAGANTAYTAPTFISMMAHNPSPMLHHQMHAEGGGASRGAQPQQSKPASASKQGYGASYWTST